MGWGSKRAQAVFEALNAAFNGDGIMVAVTALDASGPAFWRSAGLAEDARFEIGSITKTMTATLLASLAGDAVVALDDEIGRWAYQLLGLVLERASGQKYEDLLAERLLGPLGMSCSGIGAAGGGTRITGHSGGKPAGHWDFALPGPGAVESTVGDLARYLSACLVPPAGPLGTAIRLCEQPRVRMGGGSAGGLAWIITGGLLFHNGGTGGFSASAAIDQAAGHAVGALVSTSGKSVSLLDAAVMTAVRGGDPRSARPQGFGAAAGPEWTQRATEMAQALLDGKFAEIHWILVPAGQARLGADRLGQMWQFALQRIGDPGPVSVSCRSLADGSTVPGEVAALITFAGSKQQLRLFVRFTASGQIAMLRVLAADEVAPW